MFTALWLNAVILETINVNSPSEGPVPKGSRVLHHPHGGRVARVLQRGVVSGRVVLHAPVVPHLRLKDGQKWGGMYTWHATHGTVNI